MTRFRWLRAMRLVAAVFGLVAIGAHAGSELASHRHGLAETDLVAHAIVEPASPHPHAPGQPLHLEASRHAEHAACLECLLQAFSPALATAGAALAAPLPRVPRDEAPPARPRRSVDFEAAPPRGPPSAA